MTVSVSGVTVDCGDAATEARFWSAALDLPLDPDHWGTGALGHCTR